MIPSHSGVCDFNPVSAVAGWRIVGSLLDLSEP